MIKWSHTLLAFGLLLSPAALAQFVDPQNVLITNVHLIDAGQEAEEVLVNMLIKDNKLELVSKDDIPVPEDIITVDARAGYLLGKLSIGETPSFIILDEDPRQNFNVFLDTEEHVLFAVNDGQLAKNQLFADLPADAEEEPEEERKRTSWLAYSPPPMALPLNYGDSSKWNQWETSNTNGIFLAAIVLDRQHWLSQNSASEAQVGDLDIFEGGEIRGFRVGAVGTLRYFERPCVYTVFGATNAFDKGFEIEDQDDFTWFDYRLDIPLSESISLSVGKQKEPISMERIMSMMQLHMQERTSVSDALLPSRNFGAVVSGSLPERRMTWAGGLFYNFIDSDDSIGSTPTQLIGRATWLPFISDDESNLVHVGFGLRHSNAKQGLQYLTEPEFNKSPIFVDTGFIDADNAMQYNLEASWRKGPYWLATEYIKTDVDSSINGDPTFSGFHVTGSWIFSGEMRAYNHKSGILGPVPVAQSVYQGGWGAWEASLRYSTLDLTDGLIDGGEMDILSLGLNWWLSPIFNVNINYRYIDNDKDGLHGESSGITTRVLLMLE